MKKSTKRVRKPAHQPRMTPHQPHDGALRTCGIEYQPFEMLYDAKRESAAAWYERMQRTRVNDKDATDTN